MSEERKIIQEQETLLELDGKSVVVSASAGSGKTSVLTRKIAKILKEEKSKIERLLVLTYTKAAAFEMKQRLNEEILKESLNNRNLISELDGISTADISTFHSFYERMLKKYSYIMGVNPSFKILSEEETNQIKLKAIKNAIKLFKTENFESYFELLSKLCTKRREDNLYGIIFKLHEFLASQDDKEKWKKEKAKITYQKEDNIAFKTIKNNYIGRIKNEKRHVEKLQTIAKNYDEDDLVKLTNEILSVLDEFTDKLTFEELYKKLEGGIKLPSMPQKVEAEDIKEKISKRKKEISKLLKVDTLGEFGDYSNIEKSFEDNARIVDSILELESLFSEQFSKLKEKEDAFDFEDLEQKMLILLSNKEVQDFIKNSYDYVFVDEFQDANLIQDKIISLVSKNNNKFLVGDPKQGIYAFRQSDSKIITDKMQEFKKLEEAESKTLVSNFRTDRKILDFNNSIFKILMNKEISDIDYENTSMFSSQVEYERSEVEPVNFIIVKEEKKEDEEILPEIYSVKNAKFANKVEKEKKEAMLIAEKISTLIHKKIYIQKKKEYKEIDFSDIAILVRKRGAITKCLCEVFDEYNIPYSFADNKNILDCAEVALMYNFLKLLVNDYDDIALANVLNSNFADVSLNELSKVKIEYPEENFFYEAVNKYRQEKTDKIAEKLNKFYKLLEDERFNFSEKGVYIEFNILCRKYDVINSKTLEEDGFSKVERIKSFLSLFLNSKYNNDIPSFIQFVENNDGELKVNASSVKESNSITISTMHASKGLEYPVVFLAGLGSGLDSRNENKDKIRIDKDLGIALRFYNEEDKRYYQSVSRKAVDLHKSEKEFSEQIRLLYVAMTRAKNAMFVSGILDDEVEKTYTAKNVKYINPKTFLNLICSCLEEKVVDLINNKKGYKTQDLCIEVYNGNDILYRQINSEKKQTVLSEDLKNKIKEQLEFKYKNEDSVKVAEKTSITKLTSQDVYENKSPSPKKFEVKEHSFIDPKDKGIILHDILEQVSFDIEDDELLLFIENYFTKKQVEKDDFFTKEYVFEKIKKAIELLKSVIPQQNKIFKEKEFMMKTSPKEFGVSDVEDSILVQGKIDLLSLGDKNIIVDYKYSGKGNEEEIKDRYLGQIKAYKLAVSKALGVEIDEMYFLLLKNSKLIKI